MKRALKNLSLLTMGIILIGCNEKISPELQEGNVTTLPPVLVPTEYYFRVTNNSATVLNYVLHRTGPNNATTPCSITTTTKLDNNLFSGEVATPVDSKLYDISCYFETEELALQFNGLSFKVEASPNTCEYVGYAPYSYFDAIPGSSSTNWLGVTCTSDVNSTDARATAYNLGAYTDDGDALTGYDPDGAGPLPSRDVISCGYMVDGNVPAADRIAVPIPTNNQTLCRYDYDNNGGGNGQNCDVGRITFSMMNVYDSDPDPAIKSVASEPVPLEPYLCGGSVAACVQGPIRQISEMSDSIKATEILNTNLNQAFSQTYTLPKLMGTRARNFDIVNFRKGLAALDMNFLDFSQGGGNEAKWGESSFKSFDPSILEKFAANKKPDGTRIIDTVGGATNPAMDYTTYINGINSSGSYHTPYAAEPFLGVNGASVNPFYTFYCMDRAYEIKARIRMVVRDWDRVFSSDNEELTIISDIYKLSAARQDTLDTEEEIADDEGVYNIVNDRQDWDNYVLMNRTNTGGLSYSAYQGLNGTGSVIWEPTSGWFNPVIFPNQGPADN